jgi:hypothetical protein
MILSPAYSFKSYCTGLCCTDQHYHDFPPSYSVSERENTNYIILRAIHEYNTVQYNAIQEDDNDVNTVYIDS